MAHKWDVKQNKPKRRRRLGMDFYEFCTFFAFFALGTLSVMVLIKIPNGEFDHISDTRNGIIGVGFIFSGLFLVKFDINAKRRAKSQFDYDLKEYEMIRTKWLENEATKLELESKYSLQYVQLGDSQPIIIKPTDEVLDLPTEESEVPSEEITSEE
jgi:hypothetical protein